MLGKMSLALVLGASISPEHNRSIGKVQTDFDSLGKSVKSLSAQSRQLDQFGRSRDAFLQAGQAAHAARADLERLRAEQQRHAATLPALAARVGELRAALVAAEGAAERDEAAIQALGAELRRAETAHSRATRTAERFDAQLRAQSDRLEATKTKAFEKKRALDSLRESLRLAGMDTARLAAEKKRLGEAIDRSRAKFEQYQRVQSARGRLEQAWGDAKGQAALGVASAVGFAAAVPRPVTDSANFEDQVRQIAITGDFAGTEAEARLGATVRRNAQLFNQTTEDINRGLQTLVAEGVEAARVGEMSAPLAKNATATRASFEDLARMTATFDKVLGVTDMELAYNQVAKAGKLGSFETRDMAKWSPALGGMMKSIGLSGNEAVVSMAARLQIAKRTAGSSDEAANNFKNFLNKLSSPDTAKDFQKLGIDLQGRMLAAAAKGLDPIAAAVDIVMQQIAKSSPEAAAAMKQMAREVAAIEDPAERAAEMERRRAFIESLGEKSGLGQMFQDMQAMSYLIAELQNQDDLKAIIEQTRSGADASGRRVLDKDFDAQRELQTEKMRAAGIALGGLSAAIGDALRPLTTGALDTFTRLASGATALAAEFPRVTQALVSGAALIGGTLVVGKLAMALRAIVGLGRAVGALGAAQSALAGGGLLARLSAVFGSMSRLALSAGRALLSFAPMAMSALSTVFKLLAFTPWGRAVSILVGAGTLIWRNWDTIKEKAAALWAGVQGAWDGAATWFQTLPRRFATASREIATGIAEGLLSGVGAVRDAVSSLGDSAIGWFKNKLGIRSPSRVFMGLGGMLGQGAALGIVERAPQVRQAVASLAAAATIAWAPAAPVVTALPALTPPAPAAPVAERRGAPTTTHITNHIQITVTQQPGESGDALAQRVATLIRAQQEQDRRAALGDWA